MWLLQYFQKEIASLALTLIGAAVLYLLRSRVRLIWSSPHAWNFLITPGAPPEGQQQVPPFNLHTASIYIQNAGRLPATEVEIVFNFEPQNYNIWPLRPFDIHRSPDGRFTIKLANLAPKEGLQIELLANAQLPMLATLRSKEAIGRQRNMVPNLVMPKWLLAILWILVVVGAATVIYSILRFLAFVL